MRAAHQRQRVLQLERPLRGVARAGDGPADRRVAADVEERRPLPLRVRRAVAEAQRLRRGAVLPLVEQELVAQIRHARRVGHRRRDDAVVRHRHRVRREVVSRGKPGDVGATDGNRVEVVAAGERVAGEELIVRRGVHVYPPAGLVVVVVADERFPVDGRRHVAQRVHVQDVPRHRVDGRRRNLVAGKRHATGREIDQRHSHRGEVALAFGRGRHRGLRRHPLPIAKALVVAEEERAVAFQRAAERDAELILLERLDLFGEVTLGVEGVVADELVEPAAHVVGAGARHDAGRGSAGAAELGRRALRQDAELGDRVYRDPQRVAAVHPVLVLRAIHQIGVLFGALAIYRVGLTLAQAAAGSGHAGRERSDTGLQQPELREVASVQGQIDQLAPGDDGAERVARGVYQPLLAGDGHRLGDVLQAHRRVDADDLADAHLNRLLHQTRELRRFDRQGIAADGQEQQPVIAVGAGGGLADEPRVEVSCRDARAGKGRRRRVGDRAFDGAGGILRRGGDGDQAEGNRGEQRFHCVGA